MTDMTGGLVRLERRGDVRLITLDDPDRRNAIGPRMRDDLAAAVAAVAADPDAAALVVTGAGSAFCAGADLPAVFGDADRPVHEVRRDLQAIYDSFLAVRRLRIPTVAAVQGPAVGAGLNLALCCRLRVLGPRATLGVTFTRIGLHPGGGCTYFLVSELGEQRALQLILEGASLPAEQAVALGLALEITDDPLQRALALADSITKLDRDLVADVLTCVSLARNSGLEASLGFEAWAQSATVLKPEIQRAVARFR